MRQKVMVGRYIGPSARKFRTHRTTESGRSLPLWLKKQTAYLAQQLDRIGQVSGVRRGVLPDGTRWSVTILGTTAGAPIVRMKVSASKGKNTQETIRLCGFIYNPNNTMSYSDMRPQHFLGFYRAKDIPPFVTTPTDFKAGNVDWVSETGQTFTWGGPRTRYFLHYGALDNTTPAEPYWWDCRFRADMIYSNGKLYHQFDTPILGFGRQQFVDPETGAIFYRDIALRANWTGSFIGVLWQVLAREHSTRQGNVNLPFTEVFTYSSIELHNTDLLLCRYPLSIPVFNKKASRAVTVCRNGSYLEFFFSALSSDGSGLTVTVESTNTATYTPTQRVDNHWRGAGFYTDDSATTYPMDRKHNKQEHWANNSNTYSRIPGFEFPASPGEESNESVIGRILGSLELIPICADYRYPTPQSVDGEELVFANALPSATFVNDVSSSYSLCELKTHRFGSPEIEVNTGLTESRRIVVSSYAGNDYIILPWESPFSGYLKGTTVTTVLYDRVWKRRSPGEDIPTGYKYAYRLDEEHSTDQVTRVIGDACIHYLDLRNNLFSVFQSDVSETTYYSHQKKVAGVDATEVKSGHTINWANRVIIVKDKNLWYMTEKSSEVQGTITNASTSYVDPEYPYLPNLLGVGCDCGTCSDSDTESHSAYDGSPQVFLQDPGIKWAYTASTEAAVGRWRDQSYQCGCLGDVMLSTELPDTDPNLLFSYVWRAPKDHLSERKFSLEYTAKPTPLWLNDICLLGEFVRD